MYSGVSFYVVISKIICVGSFREGVGTAAAERDANVMSGVGAGAALHGPRPRPLVGQ